MSFKESKMKLVFLVFVALCAVAQSQVENKWTEIKSTLKSPQQRDFIRKIFKDSIQKETRQGGQVDNWERIPYQAFLTFGGSACGGSIISLNWILTAAHCLIGNHFAHVYVGFFYHNEMYHAWTIRVRRDNFIIHEQFNRSGFINDIALIRLDSELPESYYLNSISLPARTEANEYLIGKLANVSGFALYSEDSGMLSPVLQNAEVIIAVNSFCMNPSFVEPLPESNICIVTMDRKVPCFGDSGGPLTILKSNGTPVLVGILSYGAAGCKKGNPVVFTGVHSFLDWIEAKSGIQVS